MFADLSIVGVPAFVERRFHTATAPQQWGDRRLVRRRVVRGDAGGSCAVMLALRNITGSVACPGP